MRSQCEFNWCWGWAGSKRRDPVLPSGASSPAFSDLPEITERDPVSLGSLSHLLDDLVLSQLVGSMEDRPCLNNPTVSSHGLKVPVSQTREPSCVPGFLCALLLRTEFFEGFCLLTIFAGVREPSSLVEVLWRLCWSSGWRRLPPPIQRIACWAAYLMGVAMSSRNPNAYVLSPALWGGSAWPTVLVGFAGQMVSLLVNQIFFSCEKCTFRFFVHFKDKLFVFFLLCCFNSFCILMSVSYWILGFQIFFPNLWIASQILFWMCCDPICLFLLSVQQSPPWNNLSGQCLRLSLLCSVFYSGHLSVSGLTCKSFVNFEGYFCHVVREDHGG